MWRFLQAIPRGFRGNLNGSVRQSAPQSSCRDEEKDRESLHRFATSDHKESHVLCRGNTRNGRLITGCHSEWREWKKTHFHHHYWKQQCQHCRFLEALGWSSALLLGCKLSQYWKYKQARGEGKKLADYLFSKKFYEAGKEPSLLANYISESKHTNGKDLESDVTWSKSPSTTKQDEEDAKQEHSGDPGVKQTPVAWAVSQFPSLWGKPLIDQSKLLTQFSKKLQADSKSKADDSNVDSKAHEEDVCSEVEDLDKLCNSIKYNREGNRFARSGNFVKAILCWQKAGHNGSANANFNLGLCYEIGTGVPVDMQKAVEYYTKAARDGSAVAAHNLALIYLNGGDEQVKKAEALLRQASQQGLAEAQVDLGVMFTENGHMGMAAQLFAEAVQQKDSTAEYYLGLCHENGLGVPRNLCKAADLYSRASKQGHTSAQFSLATFFENGYGGLPVDKTAACDLYQKSASGGHSSATKHVARLNKELNKHSDLVKDESIGIHLKISTSVPALTSYLKNHISQLGKLEWEWTPLEDDHLRKASTVSDFRGITDSTKENLFEWDGVGHGDTPYDFFDNEDTFDSSSSSSVVKFNLGEGDPLATLCGDQGEEESFSLSGQFGDIASLSKNSKSGALHRSPSFDRLSFVSDSDRSEVSIVFDDNFEGFRLVQNKAQQKEEKTVCEASVSGLRRMSANNYSEFDMFDSSWSLNDMSDLSPGRQVLACN